MVSSLEAQRKPRNNQGDGSTSRCYRLVGKARQVAKTPRQRIFGNNTTPDLIGYEKQRIVRIFDNFDELPYSLFEGVIAGEQQEIGEP